MSKTDFHMDMLLAPEMIAVVSFIQDVYTLKNFSDII